MDFHVLLIEELQNIHIKIDNLFKEEIRKILFKAWNCFSTTSCFLKYTNGHTWEALS